MIIHAVIKYNKYPIYENNRLHANLQNVTSDGNDLFYMHSVDNSASKLSKKKKLICPFIEI